LRGRRPNEAGPKRVGLNFSGALVADRRRGNRRESNQKARAECGYGRNGDEANSHEVNVEFSEYHDTTAANGRPGKWKEG